MRIMMLHLLVSDLNFFKNQFYIIRLNSLGLFFEQIIIKS